jgi:hypothetical protein
MQKSKSETKLTYPRDSNKGHEFIKRITKDINNNNFIIYDADVDIMFYINLNEKKWKNFKSNNKSN